MQCRERGAIDLEPDQTAGRVTLKRVLLKAIAASGTVVSVIACAALADTIVVPDDATFQAALDAAATGDTVLVRAGTYPGPFTLSNKDVTLVGESGSGSTVLDGQDLVRVLDVGSGVSTATRIVGFAITRGRAANGSGIMLASNSGLTIESCHFSNCTPTGGDFTTGALHVGENADCILRESMFTQNSARQGGALYLGLHVSGHCRA